MRGTARNSNHGSPSLSAVPKFSKFLLPEQAPSQVPTELLSSRVFRKQQSIATTNLNLTSDDLNSTVPIAGVDDYADNDEADEDELRILGDRQGSDLAANATGTADNATVSTEATINATEAPVSSVDNSTTVAPSVISTENPVSANSTDNSTSTAPPPVTVNVNNGTEAPATNSSDSANSTTPVTTVNSTTPVNPVNGNETTVATEKPENVTETTEESVGGGVVLGGGNGTETSTEPGEGEKETETEVGVISVGDGVSEEVEEEEENGDGVTVKVETQTRALCTLHA